ncbi:diguanylate cyclase domain-containing protein [Steroidobacter gossypii]|uniref:diguanylate cyclase domain-containing protein n=1 Tax=Steroidobacter gossypii TaxID=2805490 RepID=UPI002AC31854|nr:diguanylate cyclase [Steroidobacter gossypii]
MEPRNRFHRSGSAEASQDDDASAELLANNLTRTEAQQASILIVEDEGIVAQDLMEALTRLGYRISGVASEGTQAVAMATQLRPELVVMDVSLRGDIDGIQAARMMQEQSQVPIIFLTGHRDSETLQRAVLTGPLGYLIKPFQEDELRCAIEVAIHKHRAELAVREREEALRRNAELLQNLSLIDELTQLRNRRGFFDLAQQALKVAQREHYAMGVFFMDLNGLKRINDTLGHQAGDQALRDTADVLRDTFRSSDILARIGGDEFVAMAHVHSTQDLHALSGRLREHLTLFNQARRRPYLLNISVGKTLVDIPTEENLESLLARADAAMYEEKRAISGRR